MKKLVYYFIIIVSNSCSTDYETITNYIITNNSDHKIQVNIYKAIQKDTIKLFSGQSKNFEYQEKTSKNDAYPLDFIDLYADSVVVFFDDSISIIHSKNNICLIEKCIADRNSYAGGKISDYKYEYEYEFTNTDYNNALTQSN